MDRFGILEQFDYELEMMVLIKLLCLMLQVIIYSEKYVDENDK